ncbi:MAG: glycosyltransferase family 1 protein, partial [Chitinophagaceae bacterium]
MRVLWLAPYPLQELTEKLSVRRAVAAGTGMWLLHLSQALASNDSIELHILTFSHAISGYQYFQLKGIHFHVVNYSFPLFGKGPSLLCYNRLTRYRSLLATIDHKIREIQPDLIHAHGTEEAYSLAALKSGLPSVTSIQGIIHEINRVAPTFEFRLQLPIERVCLEKHQHFGCRTQWDSALVRRFNPSAVIHYMPEAINPLYFYTPRQTSECPTITFVGGLVDRKGIGVLIQAIPAVIKQLPNAKFIIIGSGNQAYVNSLKAWANQQGIAGHISWQGSQTPAVIAATLARSSVYVLPTFMDNSPNSLCEAMAMGVPIISTEVGGVPSLIETGHTGFLIPVDNVTRLSQAILQ